MSAQGAEFVRSGGKRLPLWQKTTENGTKRQAQSLQPSVQYLEAGWKSSTPGFLASDRSQCYSGWSSAQQGADNGMSLQGYGNANVGKSGGAPAEYGHGERYEHRLSQEGQVPIDQGGKFHGARALDFLVCGAIHEPHLPADG